MAGGVLIEQRVVEQKAAVGDGGIDRNQGAFAEIVRAFVHLDHLGQHVVVGLRVPLDGPSFLEANPELVDQLADYMLSKELLNSCYGMMVTNIIRDEITYTDDWDQSEVNIEEKLKFYNESKKRFISYAWGVWVTAYARYNLFTAIKRCWGDYIYSDTDSIKLTNHHLYKDYFDGYNNNIIRKIERSAKHHNLSTELYMPKTIKGETKVIGAWDYEGTYDKFKTLGAKRYMVEKDGGIQVTVSGINKMFCEPYLMRKYDDPFKAFDNNLHIPAQYTGKNIHTYIDDPQEGRIIDYKGLKGSYNELSSVHIEEADYHLSVAQNYINFLLSITEDIL